MRTSCEAIRLTRLPNHGGAGSETDLRGALIQQLEIVMSEINTVRAWKDEEYRQALSQAELDLLPENPAGVTEVSDSQLAEISGAKVIAPCTCACLPKPPPCACTFYRLQA